jgi:MFS family permease
VVFLILTGVIGSFIASIIPFISLYLVDARGVEERVAAALLSVIYAAGFFAAPLGGHISDLFGRRRVMIALGIATGPAIAALLIAPYPVAFAALMLGIGVLMFTKMPTAEAHIASEVPLRMRSTVLGIYFFSGMEGSALLTPFLGSIIDQHGFHTAFIGTAVVMAFVAVTCAVGLYLLKRGEAAQFE